MEMPSVIHRWFNPALCLAGLVWDQLEQSWADRAVSTRKKQRQTGCSGTCLLSQHSVNRARRPELTGRLGHIVRTAHPQKNKEKKSKERESERDKYPSTGETETSG